MDLAGEGVTVRASVRDAWVGFSVQFEGFVPHFYLDVKSLVTIGIGNLVDPLPLALDLPMRHLDGRAATKEEIAREWARVKSDPSLARLGHRAARQLCKLQLMPQGIYDLVQSKLAHNDRILSTRFPRFVDWPADAQLATHSMAWACGPHFVFPRLAEALAVEDFATAAAECRIQEEGNPGIVPRNKANRLLYSNAAHVVANALRREILYWPTDLSQALGPDIEPHETAPREPDDVA